MDATSVRKAVQRCLVALGIVTLAMAASEGLAVAAVRPSTAHPAVAALEPANGQVVGIAHPVIVRFAEPVSDRAAAEQSITVTSSKSASGQFVWMNTTVLQWVPDQFWPARTHVSVLAGDLSTSFETGAAVVGVADISAHTFTVSIDDQVALEYIGLTRHCLMRLSGKRTATAA